MLIDGVHRQDSLVPRFRLELAIFFGYVWVFLHVLDFTVRPSHLVVHYRRIRSVVVESFLETCAVAQDLNVFLCARLMWLGRVVVV